MRRILVGAALAAGMIAGAGAVTAPNAAAAENIIVGVVDCDQNYDEVGIWVDARVGKDGWADRQSDGEGGMIYVYTLSEPTDYQLHVGCGGTLAEWQFTIPTTWLNNQHNHLYCSTILGVCIRSVR